jgi:DNA-binding CsgD family transcriptional regulator
VPPAQVDRLDRLAPLELEVALAAGAGAPVEDIAHRLFLGRRSAWLLQASAMTKLGVTSTAELAASLGHELGTSALESYEQASFRA